VVVYRLSKVSYAIARRFVTVPHVAMANLIAGRRVVPELIQTEFTAANVVAALRPLLADGPARTEAMAGLCEIRERLHTQGAESAVDRAARICMELLGCDAIPTSYAAGSSTEGPERSAQSAGTYQA
jgi:lipid-A-disaccharide synthase